MLFVIVTGNRCFFPISRSREVETRTYVCIYIHDHNFCPGNRLWPYETTDKNSARENRSLAMPLRSSQRRAFKPRPRVSAPLAFHPIDFGYGVTLAPGKQAEQLAKYPAKSSGLGRLLGTRS